MKHSFRVKVPVIKKIFSEKLGFKSLTIETKEDVYNAIHIILSYIDLDEFLSPANCSYGFVSKQLEFGLELKEGIDKKLFFKSIKTFEDFMEL